ncbi:MAG: hydrogenase maturation nickel metallochaperone HypA [Saprospiraceae bacterium]
MHELSIALGIVDLAESEAKKAGGTTIESIELEIGELSGVEIDALEFAWSSATANTMLEKATKTIETFSREEQCALNVKQNLK